MDIKTISITISIIGISLLLILSQTLQPKLSKISEIREQQEYTKVRIQGQLINQKNYVNFSILTLQDSSGKIQSILNSPIQIKNNSNLEITGKITQYKNQNQIAIDKIKLI